MPRKRITISIAPADVSKDSSSFDQPIAAAILAAAGQIKHQLTTFEALHGELGLDVSQGPVRSIMSKLLAGRAKAITTFYILDVNSDKPCSFRILHSSLLTN